MGPIEHNGLTYLFTLADRSERHVFRASDGVLHVVSPLSGAHHESFKRSYDRYVDAYPRAGFVGRIRDLFHVLRARAYKVNRHPLLSLLTRLTTPVPRIDRYGRFLDVGCNTGHFLAKLPDPWQRYGVETSRRAASAARRYCNISIFDVPLEQLDTELHFDFIHASHVIEHVEDYNAFLRKMRELLTVGGAALLYTPNTGSLGFRIFRKYWQGLYDETHVRLFDIRNLSAACEQAGYHVVATGTYYMGMTGYSLLRWLRLDHSTWYFRLLNWLLFLVFLPVSPLVNSFKLGGALYIHLTPRQANAGI